MLPVLWHSDSMNSRQSQRKWKKPSSVHGSSRWLNKTNAIANFARVVVLSGCRPSPCLCFTGTISHPFWLSPFNCQASSFWCALYLAIFEFVCTVEVRSGWKAGYFPILCEIGLLKPDRKEGNNRKQQKSSSVGFAIVFFKLVANRLGYVSKSAWPRLVSHWPLCPPLAAAWNWRMCYNQWVARLQVVEYSLYWSRVLEQRLPLLLLLVQGMTVWPLSLITCTQRDIPLVVLCGQPFHLSTAAFTVSVRLLHVVLHQIRRWRALLVRRIGSSFTSSWRQQRCRGVAYPSWDDAPGLSWSHRSYACSCSQGVTMGSGQGAIVT